MMVRKAIARLVIAVILIVAVVTVLCMIADKAHAEEEPEYDKVWVLCQPDSWVNVREFAKYRSNEVAIAEPGDWFYTDGQIKNGFIHVYGTFEDGSGWINTGYVVHEEPQAVNGYFRIASNGRVACRKSINGDRRCWVYCDDIVMVYWKGHTWSITNKGFIKTEFINFGMEVESDDESL